jgi:NTE family protein
MKISLALGGGGSRGYAHIGVLRRLQDESIRIRAIAGTSAGAIVAVAYAAGIMPDEMETIFSKIDQTKLFARAPNEGPGLLGLSGAARFLEEIFGNKTFAELRIPCAVVAVDLKEGREVILNEGQVVEAILASIAIPGVFPPRIFGDSQLVDGAVMNPVPVSVARSLAPTLPVVAVVLDSLTSVTIGLEGLPLLMPMPAQLVQRLTHTRVAQAFHIFLQSVDVGSLMLAEMRLLIDNPDVVIRPNVSGIGVLDNVDVHNIIYMGEFATEAVLRYLKRATSWPNQFSRWLVPHR